MATISKTLNNLSNKYFIPMERIIAIGKPSTFGFDITLDDGKKINILCDEDVESIHQTLVNEMQFFHHMKDEHNYLKKVRGVGFFLNQTLYKDLFININYEILNAEDTCIDRDGITDLANVDLTLKKEYSVYSPYQFQMIRLFKKHNIPLKKLNFQFALMYRDNTTPYKCVNDVLGINLTCDNPNMEIIAQDEMKKRFKVCYPIYEGEHNTFTKYYYDVQDAMMDEGEEKIYSYNIYGFLYTDEELPSEFTNELMSIVTSKFTSYVEDDYVCVDMLKMDGTPTYSYNNILGSDNIELLIDWSKYIIDTLY